MIGESSERVPYLKSPAHQKVLKRVERYVTGRTDGKKTIINKILGPIITPFARSLVANELIIERVRRDVKNSQRRVEIAEENSMKDSLLVGFYNRRYLSGRDATETSRKETGILEKEYDRAKRHKHNLVVAMVDLDNFKGFNDRFGHPIGDKLLATFSEAVNNILRGEDIKARYGGDEFCLIFPETNTEQVSSVIGRIQSEYKRLQKVNLIKQITESSEQSLSIGISSLANQPSTYLELIVFADNALYIAKKSGKDKMIVYNKEVIK